MKGSGGIESAVVSALRAGANRPRLTASAAAVLLTIIGFCGGIVFKAGGQIERLETISIQLAEIKGAQQTFTTQIQALELRMTTNEERDHESRVSLETLKTQMAYRLELEGRLKMLHEELR